MPAVGIEQAVAGRLDRQLADRGQPQLDCDPGQAISLSLARNVRTLALVNVGLPDPPAKKASRAIPISLARVW